MAQLVERILGKDEVISSILISSSIRRHDGMADVTDSKSVGSNTVWVQVPLPAPEKSTLMRSNLDRFFQRSVLF